MATLSEAKTAVTQQNITYTDGQTQMKGYLVTPKDLKEGQKVPGVLVVHEWWGQTDYPRKRADQLAQLGYVALAVDMYGEGQIASHPKDAGEFARKTNADITIVKSRFLAAFDALKSQPHVEANNIFAIGYCFGGGVVLTVAREGVPLNSVVSFHGSLPGNPFEAQRVKANVLVLNGKDDSFIPAKEIERFNEEMKKISGEYNFVQLEGAKHGFSNPEATTTGKRFDMDVAYHRKADQKSWKLMREFIQKNIQ